MKTKMTKYQGGGATKKSGAKSKLERNQPSYMKSQAEAEKLYNNEPSVRTYKNEFTGKKIPTGPMSEQEYKEAAMRAASKRGNAMLDVPGLKKGGIMKTSTMKKMKTGGMVNSNAKVQALKSASTKGVMSGVNPKAAASKVAKGRSGGTSAAPKTAVPKAKYGMSMTKMKKK